MSTALTEAMRRRLTFAHQCSYDQEHPVGASEFDDTLEVWTVKARIDADGLAGDMALYSDVDENTLDAVQDLPVGRMSFVRVRMSSETHGVTLEWRS
ncbi:hypothetical protein ACIPPS_11070 [Streptomyces sp. NPDC090127]|uniref:hypothetical protein n=1 Tax=Streptomyces sp. NPDC090127 TaxID=3365953 RepID=UPI003804A939